MDVSQINAKERKQARKNLLKKIETYNKQLRKTRRPSFPITSPSKDLQYKGIVKVTYDRGYALQTKSLLLESTTTAAEVVEQLFDALGLRGSPSDYALEERNIMTGEIHLLGSMEAPLNLQLDRGSHQGYMELRLVQMRDTLAAPMLTTVSKGGRYGNMGDSDDASEEEEGSPNVMPKEEVTDHGIATVELVMEEALQDIPPLVHDIQERLKVLSETVAVDGKPRAGLPTRRLLWDILKPQASALVKDIRRLVDNGEFLANKHCTSPVIKLIVTLILELITDHSREMVSVTKEMCGLRGAAKTEFTSSVSGFIQEITYISKLVGKVSDSLHAMAVAGHLFEATSPENFQNGRLQPESYFSGSGNVSGVLIFTVVSAYLGLVRAAYEDKQEYYASLATNMLRSTQRATEIIQKTEAYTLLHLHPLRSRVRDMEHKVKVAMDNLIRGVRVAASSRPPPDASPEMLLYGYALIMATLDFLMVVQCASLLHKVVVSGWDLMQFPWVRAIADAGPEGKSDTAGAPSLGSRDQLSSLSDSTSSAGESSVGQRGEKLSSERRSRIPTHPRESGDGMDAAELAASDKKGRLSFQQLGLRASQIRLPYSREGEEEADDEGGRPPHTPTTPSPPATPLIASDTESEDVESQRGAIGGGATAQAVSAGFSVSVEEGQYMGIDAVQKLRLHYNINKAIAKGAESLLLTVTQKTNVLSSACRDRAKEKYPPTVELILAAAKQIREEVSTMEVDLLVGLQGMAESLERSRTQMESAVRDVQLATLMASSPVAPDSAGMKLMAAVGQLKEVCSETVGDALATAGEHKKALEQAEKIEQEFISLMTGQKQESSKPRKTSHGQHEKKKFSSPAKLAMAGDAGIVFEDTSSSGPLAIGGLGRGWSTKETPKVIGGTVQQLVHRLTYHRMIDSEFAEIFLLTFYSFMTPEQLMDTLISRYNIHVPGELTSWEEDAFEIDVAIPIRLRVIQAVRTWLKYSYDDFRKEAIVQKLKAFIKRVQISMSSCAKQLHQLLEENQRSGPVHIRSKPRGSAPTPLVPLNLSHGDSFDLLDVNTLELARQLALAYSGVLREVRPQELLSLGWKEESRHDLVPHIISSLQMSKNMSELVCKEVQRESVEDEQASVISYFIQTAKNCLDLKNYEAVFAIMRGLGSRAVQQESAWQMLSDHLLSMYEELKVMVSPEINHHRYRQDIRVIHQSPTVPHLRLILTDIEAVDKDHLDFLPQMKGVVNFQKRRQFGRIIQQLQKYQSIPYNFHPIEVMQRYLRSLGKQLSGEEMDQLSTNVETLQLT